MKIFKLNIFSKKPIVPKTVTKQIPPCPIDYNPNNVTREEYTRILKWAADNQVNMNIQEPPRFVTEEERRERAEFARRVREYRRLAEEEGIGITFFA